MLAEYAAMKARLNADTVLAGKGSDTIRMEAGLPVRDTYWVLFGGAPDELDDGRLSSLQFGDSDAEYVYTFRFVSITNDAVLKGAQRAITQLLGWAPTIEGRNCGAVTLEPGDHVVDADTRVTPPLLFIDLDFGLKSSRA